MSAPTTIETTEPSPSAPPFDDGSGNTLEADDEGDDSGIGSDAESSGSASLTSSIIGYKYENGRRYHAYREGQYLLPNDDREQARLDLVHHLYRLIVDGRLYLAPISQNMKRCLDFGTGTGIWAIEIADEFPNCEVVGLYINEQKGTDLSPIQPSLVPQNCSFYVDDVEADWNYRDDEKFDFIHGRGMGGSILDWGRLFKQVFQNLKPGGYFEMQEYAAWQVSKEGEAPRSFQWRLTLVLRNTRLYSNADPTLEKIPNVKGWIEKINEASASFGRPIDMADKQKTLMEEAGFVDVEQIPFSIPVGLWAKGRKAKELGICNQEVVLEGVDAFTVSLFTRVLGWKREECEVLMAHCKQELRDPKNQLYGRWYFCYGRKPE